MLGFLLIVVPLVLGRLLGGRGWQVMAAAMWALVLALHLAAPDSAAARTLGGSATGWLVAGGLVALILGYRRLLRKLRQQATPVPPAPLRDQGMSDAELDRYARHLVLQQIGGAGQMRLRNARVLVVGAGGLGSPLCLYLAAAGVGRITLADDDTVSLSNLQRQVIFRDDLRGEPKAYAAAEAMLKLNPQIDVVPLIRRIGPDDQHLIAEQDLVIDGTDSFAGRAVINRACVAAQVPLLWGAIGQWEGQVTLFDPARGGPCMACLFPQAPLHDAPCAEAGVVGALPGVIGSMMGLEAIKHLTDAGQGLRGRMMLYDGLYGESRMIGTTRDPQCPVCAPQALVPAAP